MLIGLPGRMVVEARTVAAGRWPLVPSSGWTLIRSEPPLPPE
jgi:hypothetical protein